MIFLFGLDAYDWRWRTHLEAHGFQVAPLLSPHATSGPAWNSIMSGRRWETHQHAGQPGPDGQPALSEPPPYLWDHLLARGREAIVVNVPFIWPPSPIRLQVCGYPSPREGYAFPREAEADWPHHELDLVGYDYAGERQTWPEEDAASRMARAQANRWALAHRFRVELAKGWPDLAVLCLQGLDRLSHLCREALAERLDETLEDLLGVVEGVTQGADLWTFLVSDHGCDLSAPDGTPRKAHTHGEDVPGTELGVFAYRGPGATALPEGAVVNLEDVLPTLLWRLGQSPVFPIDGRARVGIAAATDTTAVRHRLEALGYV